MHRRKKVVLAANFATFKSWCWDAGITVRDAIYVRDISSILGLELHADQMVYIGRHFDNPSYDSHLYDYISSRNSMAADLESARQVDAAILAVRRLSEAQQETVLKRLLGDRGEVAQPVISRQGIVINIDKPTKDDVAHIASLATRHGGGI